MNRKDSKPNIDLLDKSHAPDDVRDQSLTNKSAKAGSNAENAGRKKDRSISPHSRLMGRRSGRFSSSSSISSANSDDEYDDKLPNIVAVTSCRSDAYYHQKAPGSAAKLPSKAPSALKLFHELATGVKDAYEAVGATPKRPQVGEDGKIVGDENELVLWDFMGNLTFLLALVDEVAVDTATRGALKDDTTFKCLRDVIKKCNRVLETMLVKRERKYTLYFRLTTPQNVKHIAKMKAWNEKVEKAVGVVTDEKKGLESDTESEGDFSEGGLSKAVSASGIVERGRGMFGKGTKGRRATPTPRLRSFYAMNGPKQNNGNAADDGFFAPSGVTLGASSNDANGTSNETNKTEKKVHGNGIVQAVSEKAPGSGVIPLDENIEFERLPQSPAMGNLAQALSVEKPIQPKEELVDVIRGLNVEKKMNKEIGGLPGDLKPNWLPKADVPSSVPKLPTEYIHRHRLMKQVVNSLLDRPGAGPRDTDEENISHCYITSITSRHTDKSGNGKTILAAAAIQTVEIRERFCDGICWIKLGRRPLTELDIRALYEEIHLQIFLKGSDCIDDFSNKDDEGGGDSSGSSEASFSNDDKGRNNTLNSYLSKSRRRFQAGELEGMKEDLYKIICRRKILICLDDVWSVEDAHWFLFHFKNKGNVIHPNIDNEECHFRILVTTRQPGLLGNGNAQEIYVRIFSEHEAVKLLLSSAGKRPYWVKDSPVFADARVIVKGCGNSPLAVRTAGGMLARIRHWTRNSPTWIGLVETCKNSLEEATKIRSFTKAVGTIIDLAFTGVENVELRKTLRRCFVVFAIVFQSNDRMKKCRGIQKNVILRLFDGVRGFNERNENGSGNKKDRNIENTISSELILHSLETMHLLEKARPRNVKRTSENVNLEQNVNSSDIVDDESRSLNRGISSVVGHSKTQNGANEDVMKVEAYDNPCYIMHDSIVEVANTMSTRSTHSFAPDSEDGADDESVFAPLRNAAKYFASIANGGDEQMMMSDHQFHDLMVVSLTNGNYSSTASVISDLDMQPIDVQSYLTEFLPNHLIRAKAYSYAGEMLVDKKFIMMRVAIMGSIEATRRHVSDLIDLKRESSKSPQTLQSNTNSSNTSSNGHSASDTLEELNASSAKDNSGTDPQVPASPVKISKDINVSSIIRDSSRRIVDEIYRHDSSNDSNYLMSLNVAVCLSSIGEGLVRCRQARDAMLRLEEAVGIYRGLLGPYHIDLARALNCVAKALVKLGENRLALLKFAEAARIYEACNITQHFDAISNVQSMASLLVDLGDYVRAETKYEDVLQLRKIVNGDLSYQVARTHNEYAAILAKQGKLDEAIQQYDEARISLRGAASLYSRETDDFDDRFNTTVIDLNIASIKAKKGDIEGAISCYEVVVQDLRKSRERANGVLNNDLKNEGPTYSKHIIAAMNRIGSLKLKQRDNIGSLEMFEGILTESKENNDRSTTMRLETARAHIKCATIYRQERSSTKKAIKHLKEALKLYTHIYGSEHRDTQALAASLKQWQQDDASTVTSVVPEGWD